jgi:hypothetical protein
MGGVFQMGVHVLTYCIQNSPPQTPKLGVQQTCRFVITLPELNSCKFTTRYLIRKIMVNDLEIFSSCAIPFTLIIFEQYFVILFYK